MNQTCTRPVNTFTFFIAPDKNLIMQCPKSFSPVAAFAAVLRVGDLAVQASFSLDDNGNPQHSNFPFETLSVSVDHQQVYINGLSGFPMKKGESDDARSAHIQGIITALIPMPRGSGNQYLTIFIGQKPGKGTRICCCGGRSNDVFTIYSALSSITNPSIASSSLLDWRNS